jgi:hypothetical protein
MKTSVNIKDGLRRHAVRYSILIFWFSAMFFLARYEAFPELFTHRLRGYRSVLSESVLMQDSWSRILINGTPVGYSHTGMNVEEGQLQNIEINNRTRLRVSVMGQPLNIRVYTTLLLDSQYDMIKFESSVLSKNISLHVGGQKVEGRMYNITTDFGGTKTVRCVEIPKDVLLYSPMNSLALRKLRPGQSISIRTMDPLSLTPTRIIVKAVKKEFIKNAGESVEATLLISSYQGMQLRSWIDKNGTVLRQETPMGWVIENCSSETALDSAAGESLPPDIAAQKSGNLIMKLLH